MSLQGIRTDESGVSPVIGIVLMVAITILLAATVSAFVFGFDDKAQKVNAPTIAVDFDYDNASSGDVLEIHHKSGDSTNTSKLVVSVTGASCGGSDDPNARYGVASDLGKTGAFMGGERITLDGSSTCSGGALSLSGAEVSLIWVSDTGQSTEIQSWGG